MIKVKLAQRIAIDCQNYEKAYKEKAGDPENGLYLDALFISYSIKAAYLCRWFQVHKWFNYFRSRQYTPEFIMAHWSRKEMSDACEKIFILEGGDPETLKKKLKEAEEKLGNYLAGMLLSTRSGQHGRNSNLNKSTDSQSENFTDSTGTQETLTQD